MACASLVIGALRLEILLSLIQVNWLVLIIMDELLVENHKPVALELLVPQTICQLGTFHLRKVSFELLAVIEGDVKILLQLRGIHRSILLV